MRLFEGEKGENNAVSPFILIDIGHAKCNGRHVCRPYNKAVLGGMEFIAN